MYGGEDLGRAVGSGKLKGGSGSILGEGMKRAGPQRERDGGDSFLATTDSIRRQHRTAFCTLKHTRSSYKLAIYYVDSGLSFDASSEVHGGEDLALAAGGGRGPGEQGGTSSIRSFWLSETSFHAFIWMCSFIMDMVFDTHATLSDGN